MKRKVILSVSSGTEKEIKEKAGLLGACVCACVCI